MQHSDVISNPIEALHADRDELVAIGRDLTPADWQAPSGCAGWSVQDVVAHMGALFWLLVDRTALPDVGALPTEEGQERCVAARRSWSPAEVLADYETVSAKALEALVDLEQLPIEIPLGDLGTYPAAVLPSAYTFDHYTHIRADLFGPRGPLTSAPPASDPLRLAPTLDWIEAAAPQQNAGLLADLGGAVTIDVTGPVPRSLTLGAGDVVASIETGAHELVLWATQRGTWEDLGVTASGAPGALAAARRLHVF